MTCWRGLSPYDCTLDDAYLEVSVTPVVQHSLRMVLVLLKAKSRAVRLGITLPLRTLDPASGSDEVRCSLTSAFVHSASPPSVPTRNPATVHVGGAGGGVVCVCVCVLGVGGGGNVQ